MSACRSIQQKSLLLDLYRTPFFFLLPDSRDHYCSFLGTVLSLLTMLVLGGYLIYRVTVLVLLEEYKIMHSTHENHFEVLPGFAVDDGFRIAAGVVPVNGSEEPIEDPEIGTVKFYLKYYNHPDFENEYGFHELEWEYCDPAKDFNDVEGSKPETGFYPTYQSSSIDLAKNGNLLKCVREPYAIAGNFDTSTSSTLMVIFEKCDRTKRTCKSEEEIEQWTTQKWIYTIENQKKFVSYEFGAETIQEHSYGNWYSLSYKSRTDFPIRIKRSAIKLSDNIFDIGGLFAEKHTGFILEKLPPRLLPYPQPFMNAITYEVSLVEEDYQRQVYTVLGLVSDMGGLFGGLSPICSVLVTLFQYHGAYFQVMSDLYTGQDDSKQNSSLMRRTKTLDKRQDRTAQQRTIIPDQKSNVKSTESELRVAYLTRKKNIGATEDSKKDSKD